MKAKRALVTGASRGIGRGIALRLAQDGWDVAVHFAEREAEARAVAQELGDRSAGLYRADLADPRQAPNLIADAVADGRLDALVNNAGVYRRLEFLDSSDEEFADAFDRTFRINWESPLRLVRAACLHFREQGAGKVVNVASRVGHRGEQRASCYSASKAALINLTRALAVEMAPLNIQHFAIAPGWVETAMARDGMDAARLARVLSEIPMGRMASPEDCAAAVAFLLREETAYMTGIVVDINGASYLR